MDRKRKLDRDHNVGLDQQAAHGESSISGRSCGNNTDTHQAKITSKSSNSKFNRILGNLERSILSQFNHSEKSHSDSQSKQRIAKTSAKRKQIIHVSQQQPAVSDPTKNSDLVVTDQQAASFQQQQHRSHDETARRHHLMGEDKITSSLKGSVVKSPSEKFGKLTLNPKCQQQESPRQPSSLHLTLATSRLSIPPPHANDEARSLNQTLLFGNGAIPATLQATTQHQQLLPETSTSGIEPKATASSAVMSSTLNPKQGQSSNQKWNDRLLAQQQHANRPNASPASSAKSLPAIAPKPVSHRDLKDNNLKTSTSQEEDEESGFATYQSRRAILQNFQQKQRQLHSSDAKDSNEEMILNRANQFPNSYPNHQAMNRIQHHQAYTNHPHQNNVMFMPNNLHLNRYNLHMMTSSNQVPILPNRDSTFSGVHYNGYSNNQKEPQLHNGFMFNQNPDLAQRFQIQQGNFLDSHHKQMQVQRMIERQQSTENSQQIYANAPPKPRRYQYHDGAAPTPASRVTSQPSMSISQTIAQPNSINPMNSQIASLALVTRQQVHSAQPLPNQQLVFNHQGQLCQPQVSYPSNLIGGQTVNNSTYSVMPHSIAQCNRDNLVHPHHQFRNHDQTITQHTMGFSTMKSKSSLDADDVMRFRQNRQLHVQASAHNHRQQQQQPLYGYHPINHATNIQQQSIHPTSNYNQNLRPQPLNFLPCGNLQRSKSVTHLLPESNEDNRNRLFRLNILDQMPSNGQKNFSAVSSVSTNHINNIGVNQSTSLFSHPHANEQNGAQLTHQRSLTKSQRPTDQHREMCVNVGAERTQQLQQLRAPASNSSNSIGASQFFRARSMATLNNDMTISNKSLRHAPGNLSVTQEGGGSRKPSLDDQIKYLLIGGPDNLIVPRASHHDGGISVNNQDKFAIYQAFDSNDKPHASVAPSSSDALIPSRTLTTVATPSAWTRNTNVDQAQREASQTIASTRQPSFSNERNTSKSDQVDSNLHAGNSIKNKESPRSALVNLGSEMGNRQQRQYQLSQETDSETRMNSPNNSRRQGDANSHLIVDLTTPRVLAKTQTTLSLANCQLSESCSINQVGLPQISTPADPATIEAPQPSEKNQNGASLSTPNNSLSEGSAQQDNLIKSHALSSEQQIQGHIDKEDPSLERSAPYYYSDLKSKEQRDALRSIVQQKSLSPPPQLLSRSTDHNSTRLALRSATLHSGHARTLSDNLVQRQRVKNDMFESRGTNSLSNAADSISTSNIAKNIDKLFEQPFENHKSMKNPSTQSMLALPGRQESQDSSILSLNQSSKVTNTDTTSDRYCSGQLKLKNISKSKSLDNISQKSLQEEAFQSKCSINPIYENIRCSNKLLNAINDSTVSFSTSGANAPANMKALANANAASDESMDSILGSSLDDSDSCSDLIDEIKISSTDNHLNDISDLIEQLRVNQSKMAEEYKATLVRIARTINSKQDKTKDSDKLARRLQLLEMKSRKCEARSKNQLALIQMMEKVLRQSRLRAMSNRSSIATQQLSTLCNGKESITHTTCSELGTPAITTPSSSQQPSHDGLSSLDSQLEIKMSTACLGAKSIPTKMAPNATNNRAQEQSREMDAKARTDTYHPQEIIKAIVVEKQTSSAVRSKATVDRCASPTKGKRGTPSEDNHGHLRSSKTNAVTKRILDIEARSNAESMQDKDLERKSSSSCNASTDGSNSSSEHRQGDSERRKDNHGGSDEDENVDASLDDDEDFIEFLSNDTSSHRSQFEASQFSASDFNASTTTSESSTSSGAINDSMTSLSPSRKISPVKNGATRHSNSQNSPPTVGILKNRSSSCDEANPASGCNSNPQGIATDSSDERTNRGKEGKFKNVLGNVVDVDVCPMNNSSQGCSPVNNRAQALCLN